MQADDGPVILAVEDDPLQRAYLVEALTRAGYTVKEAWNGEDALALIVGLRTLGRRLDLILLDIRLPYRDGIDVLQHLGTQGVDIPVVALSAREELLPEATAAGARATLLKPYGVEALLATVARFCPS